MNFSDVQNLLEAQVATTVGLPLFQMENTRISPVGGEPWCRFTLLPSRTIQETIGLSGMNRMAGLAQIDIFYPADKGTADANAMADAIIATVPRGLILMGTSTHVHIEISWREAGTRIEQYYTIPVMLKWRANE
jgi:hypothetical protein